jgi:DnaJ-class molecular chaperone
MRRLNLLDQYAIKIGNCPEGWLPYIYEVKDDRDGFKEVTYFITGCIPDGVYRSGSKKGQPRYNKPLDNSFQIVIFKETDYRLWVEMQPKCPACSGYGNKVVAGIQTTCQICSGTGEKE